MSGEVRRRSYLAIALFGLLGCAAVATSGTATPWEEQVTYPALAAFLLSAVWVLLFRPMAVRYVEVGGWCSVAVLWLTSMAVGLARQPDEDAAYDSLFPGVFANVILLVVLSHLWFDTRWALPASLVGPVAATAIGVVSFGAAEPGGRDHAREWLAAQGYVVVTAVLVYLLARSKDALAATVAEAAAMRTLAYADPLTGLPNRRSMAERLELLVHGRRDDGPVSVVAFDLDHFKRVNDEHGHDVGDLVLREVAGVVRRSLRPGAVVGRWGGEEFLVVAPRMDADEAMAMAERLRRDIAAHPFPAGLHMTASFGVGQVSAGESVSAVLRHVDRMLYAAKACGRDAVVGRPPPAPDQVDPGGARPVVAPRTPSDLVGGAPTDPPSSR